MPQIRCQNCCFNSKRCQYYGKNVLQYWSLEEVGDADPENEMADWDCSSSRIPSRMESNVMELSGIMFEWICGDKVWKKDKHLEQFN